MLNNLRSEFVVDMLDFIEDQTGKSHCIVLEYASMNLAQYLRTNKVCLTLYGIYERFV